MRIYKYIIKLRTKKILPVILAIVLILIDQTSKYLVRSRGGFYICNQGISFGLQINPIVFWVLWLLIITTIIYIFLNNKKIKNSNLQDAKQFWILEAGILLIISGAISNIIDRVSFGCVVDLINPPFGPIFNLADVFISIGVIITVVSIYRNKSGPIV